MAKEPKKSDIPDSLIIQILDWAEDNKKTRDISFRVPINFKEARENPEAIQVKVRLRLVSIAEKQGFEKQELQGIKADLVLALEWLKKERKIPQAKRLLSLPIGTEFQRMAENGDVNESAAQIVIKAAETLGYHNEKS